MVRIPYHSSAEEYPLLPEEAQEAPPQAEKAAPPPPPPSTATQPPKLVPAPVVETKQRVPLNPFSGPRPPARPKPSSPFLPAASVTAPAEKSPEDDIRTCLDLYNRAAANQPGLRVIVFIDPWRHKELKEPWPVSFRHKPTSIDTILSDIAGRCVASNTYFEPSQIDPKFDGKKVAGEHILGRLALVLDNDVDHDWAAKPIDGIEPSMLAQTSQVNQQLHYVFSRMLLVDEFKALAELAYRKCGGDPCCKEPHLPARLPGTPNHPGYKKLARGRNPEPYMARIAGGSLQLIDPDVMRQALEQMPDIMSPAPDAAVLGGDCDVNVRKGTAEEIAAITARIPEFTQALMRQPGEDGARSDHCFHTTLQLFEHGLSPNEVFVVSRKAAFAKKFSSRSDDQLVKEIKRAYQQWVSKGRYDATKPPAYLEGGTKNEGQAKNEDKLKDDVKDEKPTVEIYTAAELKAMEFPPVKFVCEGLVVEGCTILGGRPKMGKSWFALDLAYGVATGTPVMGRACEQGDVLYCALEDNKRRIQSRLRSIVAQEDGDWPSSLYLAHSWPKGADSISAFHAWRKSVKNPRLIIVDTLKKVKNKPSGKQGDNYFEDYEAVEAWQQFSLETGVPVLILTHTRKAEADDPFDTITGTLGQTGAADNIMVMEKRKDGSIALHGKGRDMEEYSHTVSFNKEACKWEIDAPIGGSFFDGLDAEKASKPKPAKAAPKINANEKRFAKAFDECAAKVGGQGGAAVDVDVLKDVFIKGYPHGKGSGKTVFCRELKRLCDEDRYRAENTDTQTLIWRLS